MAALIHFTNFYISSDILFSDDGRKASFTVAEEIPRYNNLKLKLSVTAFDETVSKIQRLKARKGSSVDLICEMVPYTVGGELRYSFKIIDLTYSVIPRNDYKEQKKPVDNMHKAADMLANCPFD